MYETILGIVLGCITICAGVGTIVIATGRGRSQSDNTGIGGNQQSTGSTDTDAREDSQRAEELITKAKDILNK